MCRRYITNGECLKLEDMLYASQNSLRRTVALVVAHESTMKRVGAIMLVLGDL